MSEDNFDSQSAIVEKKEENVLNQNEYNSIRGKLVYVSPTEEQYELLLKRIRELLSEGRGETIIEVSCQYYTLFLLIRCFQSDTMSFIIYCISIFPFNLSRQ